MKRMMLENHHVVSAIKRTGGKVVGAPQLEIGNCTKKDLSILEKKKKGKIPDTMQQQGRRKEYGAKVRKMHCHPQGGLLWPMLFRTIDVGMTKSNKGGPGIGLKSLTIELEKGHTASVLVGGRVEVGWEGEWKGESHEEGSKAVFF